MIDLDVVQNKMNLCSNCCLVSSGVCGVYCQSVFGVGAVLDILVGW